jgi:hypothetical protein
MYQLRTELIKQFKFSPLCREVFVEKDPVIFDHALRNIPSDKVHEFSEDLHSLDSGTRNIGIFMDGANCNPGGLHKFDSLVFVKSIYSQKLGVCESEIINKSRVEYPALRVSVFKIGRIIPDNLGEEASSLLPKSKADVVMDNLYPIYSQFLPARFREISPRDLAQAVRLNYETCEVMNGPEGIEELHYVDCMKIIGLDDRI